MALLSWGKPSAFETTTCVDGAPAASATWENLPIPKEDSLQLTTNEGSEVVANEEGGDIVDVRFNKNTYQLEWDEFVKKGQTPKFDDNDGIVSGEHAFRITPEDATCKGILIDRSVVRVTQTYNVADGIIRHHVARVLKPKTGKSVKEYVAPTT